MFERPGRTRGKGGPTAYASDPVFAVRPGPAGEVVHLAIAGYQPGKKSRSAYFEASDGLQTLCAPGHAHQELCVPLAVAAQWPRFDPGGVVHANGGGSWRWCRACLGHLVEIRGLEDLVINHAVPGRARARNRKANQ